jgi:putative hydroxymethylpyrimidine transport system substrate-binding protein
MMNRQISLVLTGVLLLALLAGCGGNGGTTAEGEAKVAKTSAPPPEESRAPWVAMDGWDGAETIGIVMAERHGYYEKKKLAVTTLSPVTPALSIPDVLDGSDEIGVAHGPQVVLAKESGAPIVVIGSLVPHATAAMIWTKESGIGSIADLAGKTVAIPGLSFQRDFLETVLAQGGLTLADVKVKSVGNDLIPALLGGKADAIFGGSGNQEGAELEARGIAPVVTRVRDLGIPDYEELVLVARDDREERSPKALSDFVAATARGAAAAVKDTETAAHVLDQSGESNPRVSQAAFRAAVRMTVPLLSQTGEVSSTRTEELIDWMYQQKMIKRKMATTELLPSPPGP